MKTEKLQLNSIVIPLLALTVLYSCELINDEVNDKECQISFLNSSREYICQESPINSNEYFYYLTENLIKRWERENGNYSVFEYDSNRKLEKIEEFIDGELWYMYLTWEDKRVTRQWYKDDVPSNSKSIIELNNKNQIIRIDAYHNLGDDEWDLIRYEIFTWQNDNITKIEHYYKNENATKTHVIEIEPDVISDKGFLEKDIFMDEKISGKLKTGSNDFELHYVNTLTYDDKNNPFRENNTLSLRHPYSILYNSKNNVVTYTTEKVCCDEKVIQTLNYSWEYNDKNYPITRIVESNSVGEGCYWVRTTTYFEYNDCN